MSQATKHQGCVVALWVSLWGLEQGEGLSSSIGVCV